MAPVHRGPGPLTWVVVIGATCLSLFVFQKILWLVVPFLLAFVLYYLLAPFARRLVMAGFSPEVAAAGLSGAFLLLVGGWLLLLYPWVIAHAGDWQDNAQRYLAGGSVALESSISALQQKFSLLNRLKIDETFRQNLLELAEHFSEKHLGRALSTFATWLPSLLLAPIITFFMLRDGTRLRKFIGSAVPNAYFEKTLNLMHALDRTAQQYFLGLMQLFAIDAVLLSGGLWALGLPSPVALGLIAALLGVIPYLGPLLGCALMVMVAATDFPGNMGPVYGVIGLFVLVRLLDDIVFLPYVMGKSLHMHPLLILLMFFVGDAIAGIAGLMMVIPVLGIFMVIGETASHVIRDDRLRARHRHARRLQLLEANRDLHRPS